MYFINERHLIIVLALSSSLQYHYANEMDVRFCGFEQTCSKNITRYEISNSACCRPCECDDICEEKGTCCRDKKRHLDIDLDTKQKCLSSAYVPKGISEPSRIPSYYHRVSCPKTFNDANIKAKCEGNTLKTISGIRPVSSLDGKIVYKNKYCSYCHGERKTTAWNVIVHGASPRSCRRILLQETLNIDSITRKILSNCILQFTPPENMVFFDVLCFDESTVIKQCNMTGQWDVFDRTINNLCLNQTETGYYIFRDSDYVYQNVYCSICNNFHYKSVEDCTNMLGRFPYRPLFTLININKLSDGRKTRQCGDGEVLDTFFNTCRTLYCLWNSFAYKGKCVPFLDYTIKMGYKIVIKLVPKEISAPSNLTECDVRNLYIPVLEKLDFLDCEACLVVVYTDKSIYDIYLNFTFTPTARCTIEDIWSKFMTAEIILPYSLNLTLNNRQIVFKAFWDYPTPFKEYKIYFSKGSPPSCQGIVPTKGQICPKVQLLTHEVETVEKYHPRAAELRWVHNKKDINGSTYVCIYNYISDQHSSSSMNCRSCSLIAFIIIVLSVLRA